jgi:hypothetical protein
VRVGYILWPTCRLGDSVVSARQCTIRIVPEGLSLSAFGAITSSHHAIRAVPPNASAALSIAERSMSRHINSSWPNSRPAE